MARVGRKPLKPTYHPLDLHGLVDAWGQAATEHAAAGRAASAERMQRLIGQLQAIAEESTLREDSVVQLRPISAADMMDWAGRRPIGRSNPLLTGYQ